MRLPLCRHRIETVPCARSMSVCAVYFVMWFAWFDLRMQPHTRIMVEYENNVTIAGNEQITTDNHGAWTKTLIESNKQFINHIFFRSVFFPKKKIFFYWNHLKQFIYKRKLAAVQPTALIKFMSLFLWKFCELNGPSEILFCWHSMKFIFLFDGFFFHFNGLLAERKYFRILVRIVSIAFFTDWG